MFEHPRDPFEQLQKIEHQRNPFEQKKVIETPLRPVPTRDPELPNLHPDHSKSMDPMHSNVKPGESSKDNPLFSSENNIATDSGNIIPDLDTELTDAQLLAFARAELARKKERKS